METLSTDPEAQVHQTTPPTVQETGTEATSPPLRLAKCSGAPPVLQRDYPAVMLSSQPLCHRLFIARRAPLALSDSPH